MQLIKKPAAYCLLKKSEFFPCFELVFGYKACLFKRLLKILEKQENLNRDIRKKARKSKMTKNHEEMQEKRELTILRKTQRQSGEKLKENAKNPGNN